jgi:peptide/nickel transport system substrate-binding protein
MSSWFFGEGNPASYTNDAVTELMAQAKEETDPAKRVEILIDAQ